MKMKESTKVQTVWFAIIIAVSLFYNSIVELFSWKIAFVYVFSAINFLCGALYNESRLEEKKQAEAGR